MRVGITGHSNLTTTSVPLVDRGIRAALADPPATGFTGVSCLAPGADQVFARVVLDMGGRLEVVLPAADYRARLRPPQRPEFDALLAAASSVRVLPFPRSGRRAYLAASEAVIASVDRMVAVWDGRPADGAGGTADVVAHARGRGVPVEVVWPRGAERG
ncbi:hypothetical protein LX15_002309 [Streptoalloteichus tenebrarius]|uniref:Uncharacterized protein n=1 Tax=Streptoalloteichus tenebrarius (strain ATCC 17920 / DSM 40477 / JCM 4838 / CBS 697.72 / NBRC 16177 / NCIMB 11028 / NRRL B-12390 / A12253. 1 / ISP 5477) TaxID=1933 RepID=A0ABT1HSV9_STRSD|nr:hypothetical protein [Streptoalloteichus tenebrarius]MCP2258611.1 hypothetical protein [Streptoalloteichus tenebrarius]BFF04016.1 hypothetical protein GCM10020241_56910 [Streptoalloteichus tenebrarius]